MKQPCLASQPNTDDHCDDHDDNCDLDYSFIRHRDHDDILTKFILKTFEFIMILQTS